MIAQAATGAQTGQLVFFLYLLIPGYVAFRAYIWGNVAIDRTSRLTKLILMVIGGFLSLALTAAARHTFLPELIQILPLLGPYPEVAISGKISVQSISNLSILQSTNLILSQSAIGVVGGSVCGALRYAVIDQNNPSRKYLDQPWDELIEQVSYKDPITVVTRDGRKVTGEFEQIGNSPDDKDLLIRNPKQLDGKLEEASKIGEISYHSYQDISRIVVYDQYLDGERSWVNRQYMRCLQILVTVTEWTSSHGHNFYLRMEERLKIRQRYSNEEDHLDIDETVQLGGDAEEDDGNSGN